MIDLHSHILPNTDDGSKSMDMSVEMARQYIEMGYSKVVATPHWIEYTETPLKEQNEITVRKLESRLREENIDLDILLGNEIFINLNINEYLLSDKAARLNDSRYVLLEFSRNDKFSYIDSVIFNLQLKGYIPVIAHPERYSYVWEDPNICGKWKDKGALLQVNLPSLFGVYGKESQKTGEILLDHRMVDFLATDSHTLRVRSPKSSRVLSQVKDRIGDEDFNRIVYENPQKLIEDKDIARVEYDLYKKKRWFEFWKK